jgi:acyl dehydratase
MTQHSDVAAPYFEDFTLGQSFDAPAVTLTIGHAALYQAMTGDRLRLPLDHHASHAVTGRAEPLAHPMLAINMAIGQTTWASQRVKANLFYRGLVLRRPVFIGDTLSTMSRVVGLRQNRAQPGREATGIVALEMTTHNQRGEEVLHFWRCPMIPCRASDAATGHHDNFDAIGELTNADALRAAVPTHWQLKPAASHLPVGTCIRIEARDSVTLAPELVRLTLNMAMAHTDAAVSYLGERLVYGGHTISLAFAQLTRALPDLVTLIAWDSCDHVGPVLEGDRIRSECEIVSAEPAGHGVLLGLRVESYAARGTPEVETRVLDWRLRVWSR